MFKSSMVFAVCMSVIPSFASSATIALDKGSAWTEFRFDLEREGGSWLETNSNLGVLSFTVSLTEAGLLQVSDAYLAGDRFEVFSNGISLGLTSVPLTIGDDVDDDYDLALNDNRWSSGSWMLAAGDYKISGFVREMPQKMGRGALRVVDIPEVPLPGSFPLILGIGAAFGAVALRKRRIAVRGAK